MSKALFITVNYLKSDRTIELLRNLERLNCAEEIDVVIGNNTRGGAREDPLDSFVKNFSSFPVRVFQTGGNLGYFGAANFVLNQMGHLIGDYHAVIIANNDIDIKDNMFFCKLALLCNKAAVLAPDILSTATSRHQNPHRIHPLSRLQKLQYRLLFVNYYTGWLLYYARRSLKSLFGVRPGTKGEEEREIFSAHGAFMVFTKRYFLEGGRIDAGYFLYGEEDSVSAQCRHLKLPILYCPSLVVYHNEHQTTDGGGFKKVIFDMQKKAYTYIRIHYPGMY